MTKAPIENTAIILTFIVMLPVAAYCFIAVRPTSVTGL